MLMTLATFLFEVFRHISVCPVPLYLHPFLISLSVQIAFQMFLTAIFRIIVKHSKMTNVITHIISKHCTFVIKHTPTQTSFVKVSV